MHRILSEHAYPVMTFALRFSPEYLKQIRYEAESPDEAALVYAAHAYGCSLAHRANNTVTVTLPKSDQTLTFEVGLLV